MKQIKMLPHIFITSLIAIFLAVLLSCAPPQPTAASQGLQWAIRMAESELIRHAGDSINMTNATTVLRGFEELWLLTGERKYFEFIQNKVDGVIDEHGMISNYRRTDYNMKNIGQGRMFLFLYKETGKMHYKSAADKLYIQLQQQPRSQEGVFWHHKNEPGQLLLADLYWAAPFYAEYGQLFQEPDIYKDVSRQFIISRRRAYDPETGLLFHSWYDKNVHPERDAHSTDTISPRAQSIGWYLMALVDVLEIMPKDLPDKESLLASFQFWAKTVKRTQDKKSGVWRHFLVLNDEKNNILEASSSCMFTYALAKGVRKGYLDDSYQTIAEQAYAGIIKQFIKENPDGTIDLNKICHEYEKGACKIASNHSRGVGPFLTASVEIHKLGR